MTDEPATSPPTKVDLTVAGHQVIIEAAEPLDVVAAKALELFRATEDAARRIPVGFAATGSHVERAEPSTNGHDPEWEPADRR